MQPFTRLDYRGSRDAYALLDWALAHVGGVALGIEDREAGHGKFGEADPGRTATVSADIRALIRRMSRDNPDWGAPRIHSELLKLGIDIGETSVSKYLVRRYRTPSCKQGQPVTLVLQTVRSVSVAVTLWRAVFRLRSGRFPDSDGCRKS